MALVLSYIETAVTQNYISDDGKFVFTANSNNI